jgi:hypothetical protein
MSAPSISPQTASGVITACGVVVAFVAIAFLLVAVLR